MGTPTDDTSVCTTNVSNSDIIDDEGLQQMNIMWEFPNLTAKDEATVRYHHTKLLIELDHTFPNTLCVLDQHNTLLTNVQNALINPGRHAASFEAHTIQQRNDKIKYIIVHLIKTALTLTKIRQQYNIQDISEVDVVYVPLCVNFLSH